MLKYPSEMAKNKHDLVCLYKKLPTPPQNSNNSVGTLLQNEILSFYETTGAIVRARQHQQQQISKDCIPLEPMASVYSYHGDAPDPPLSRSLIVIGVANTAVVSKFMIRGDNDNDKETTRCCFHKCLIAVKRVDGDHLAILEKKYIAHSIAFGNFMQQLRREGLVAILALDKYKRFGILQPVAHLPSPPAAAPMGSSSSSSSSSSHGPLQVHDCFATVFVVSNAKSFLMSDVVAAAVASAADSSSGGDLRQDFSMGNNIWETSNSAATAVTLNENKKRPHQQTEEPEKEREHNDNVAGENIHANAGAAAACKKYGDLVRNLETRANSNIYHLRSFNGWVKATQIQELDPKTKKVAQQGNESKNNPNHGAPMRVLDLACGKGGDLGKWIRHPRGLGNYVGSDASRGSLRDAAIRVRDMHQQCQKKLKQCTFICADLGRDRLRSSSSSNKHEQMPKLLTWSFQDEKPYTSGPPEFKMVQGGGIGPDEKFDVVSIQFAIHYMMETRKRARRFFRTVSELLEVGGNLICTTVDARVVVEHLLNLGLNYHFDDDSWNSLKDVVIKLGGGACHLSFEPKVVKKLFTTTSDGSDLDKNLFGLKYTFTLVEGSNHKAGVGADAVNLPEWLIPIPVLTALGKEAGLEIEYAKNFHEFYADRSGDLSAYSGAHSSSLYKMKVLNQNGSLSKDEWEISRLYVAIKFRKVREVAWGNQEESDEEDEEEEEKFELDPNIKMKLSG